MKKIIVSAGLAAVGVAGFQSAFAGIRDVIAPNAWNVAATLRGFYDDNYSYTSHKYGSAGFELLPSVIFHNQRQQTDIGMRYIYGLYFYGDRQESNIDPIDQTHQFDLWINHAINERWKVTISDSFAMGQEPELLNDKGVLYRANGNNFANHGNIVLDTEWTRKFSTSLHYANNFYNYDSSGVTVSSLATTNLTSLPALSSHAGSPGWETVASSLAGTMNRVEQDIALDLQWHFQPETIGFVGYNFGLVNYTGNELIGAFNYDAGIPTITSITPLTFAATNPRKVLYYSNSRDSLSHYGYLGVQHQFTPNLSGSVRGGVSYTDSYNDPLQETTSLSPYADLSLVYTYRPGSYFQIGFSHDINSTDVVAVNNATGSLTQYQESSIFYASINHRFTPKLLGTLVGHSQYSTFKGGSYNENSDTGYSVGANLNYQFNRHFSADVGYSYDNLQSNSTDPTYNRNRVYIGLSANY